MTPIELIGYIAGTLTTAAYLPQAVRVLRMRETRDLSAVTYIMLNVGMVCWLIYGIGKEDMRVIIPNAVVLLFTLPILVMKLRMDGFR